MNSTNKHIPILAITMGDPAGIGPEIAAKVFANTATYINCRPVLIGNVAIMEKAIMVVGVNLKIHNITEISQALFEQGTIDIISIEVPDVDQIQFGEISSKAGDIAFRTVKKAIELAMNGDVDGTVTGPINKEAINKAGYHFQDTPKYTHILP